MAVLCLLVCSRHHSAGTRIADIEKEHKEVCVYMYVNTGDVVFEHVCIIYCISVSLHLYLLYIRLYLCTSTSVYTVYAVYTYVHTYICIVYSVGLYCVLHCMVHPETGESS